MSRTPDLSQPKPPNMPVVTEGQLDALEAKKGTDWQRKLMTYLVSLPLVTPVSLATLAFHAGITPEKMDMNISGFNTRLKKAGILYSLKYWEGLSPVTYHPHMDMYYKSRKYVLVPAKKAKSADDSNQPINYQI